MQVFKKAIGVEIVFRVRPTVKASSMDKDTIRSTYAR